MAGYQDNNPLAFTGFNDTSINGIYLDGVSITHGSPHKHLWSYAVGFGDQLNSSSDCPCNNGSTVQVPSYVGNEYYCESGNFFPHFICSRIWREFPDDLLWDGQQCGGVEAPCCTHPNMPWFIKTLNETTTEDIELRACSSSSFCGSGSGAALFLIEIYVR